MQLLYSNILIEQSEKKHSFDNYDKLIKNAIPLIISYSDLKFNSANGYKINSLDILEFVNAIANGGRMVELSFDEGKANVYKPQIAKAENIKAVRAIFEDSNGFIRRKLQSKVSVGVMGGITQLADLVTGNCCKIELCGYFPADNPQYTMYISLYKHGIVAQLGLLTKPFEQLVEHFYPVNQNN